MNEILNKKTNLNLAAVIEIGSNNVKMRISQLKKGEIVTLDSLEHPINIGHDVFERGRISFESLRELSLALSKFSDAMNTYGVEKTKIISCSVMREAENRFLAADQIKVQNNMVLDVIEDSEEKSMIYFEVIKIIANNPQYKNSNSLIAFVGAGSIGIAVFDGTNIIYSHNLSIGALKIHDTLAGLHRNIEDYHEVLKEYIEASLNPIDLSKFNIQNIILTGAEMDIVLTLCNTKEKDSINVVSVKSLKKLHKDLDSMTPERISRRYNLSTEHASTLYSALSIFSSILRFAPDTKEVASPCVDILQTLTRQMLLPKSEIEFEIYIRQSALACAKETAAKFNGNFEHEKVLSSFSCKIFDKMKKIHGLNTSKRLLLELASQLHDCGTNVSVRKANRVAFDMIKSMPLFGLSPDDVFETAIIASSAEILLPISPNKEFITLDENKKIIIAKLSAIFRLAHSLDKSQKQKLKNIKFTIDEQRVIVKAESETNPLLERWAFDEAAIFFKEIFGLSPELIIKSNFKLI